MSFIDELNTQYQKGVDNYNEYKPILQEIFVQIVENRLLKNAYDGQKSATFNTVKVAEEIGKIVDNLDRKYNKDVGYALQGQYITSANEMALIVDKVGATFTKGQFAYSKSTKQKYFELASAFKRFGNLSNSEKINFYRDTVYTQIDENLGFKYNQQLCSDFTVCIVDNQKVTSPKKIDTTVVKF